jgi:hypothetical protein
MRKIKQRRVFGAELVFRIGCTRSLWFAKTGSGQDMLVVDIAGDIVRKENSTVNCWPCYAHRLSRATAAIESPSFSADASFTSEAFRSTSAASASACSTV